LLRCDAEARLGADRISALDAMLVKRIRLMCDLLLPPARVGVVGDASKTLRNAQDHAVDAATRTNVQPE
jgi:hypothetical protein